MPKTKYYAIIDTETAGSIGYPLIYDLGVIICDAKGREVTRDRWIIRNVFAAEWLMENAYYGEKRPWYQERIDSGEFTMVSFKKALYELNSLLIAHGVDVLAAYNLQFDLRALESTASYTKLQWQHGGTDLFWKEYEYLCLWGYACETIGVQKTYIKWVQSVPHLSEKGNPITNAEVMYRYLTGEYFDESHTALEDCEIEKYIFARCVATKKKRTGGIIPQPWRLVKNKMKEMDGE